jgi:hypothetical protein
MLVFPFVSNEISRIEVVKLAGAVVWAAAPSGTTRRAHARVIAPAPTR